MDLIGAAILIIILLLVFGFKDDIEKGSSNEDSEEGIPIKKSLMVGVFASENDGDFLLDENLITNDLIKYIPDELITEDKGVWVKTLIVSYGKLIEIDGINNIFRNIEYYIDRENPLNIKDDDEFPSKDIPGDPVYDLRQWVKRNRQRWISVWELYVKILSSSTFFNSIKDDTIIEPFSEKHDDEFNKIYTIVKNILGEDIMKENKFFLFINSFPLWN